MEYSILGSKLGQQVMYQLRLETLPEEEARLSRNAPAFAMTAMNRRTLSDPSNGCFNGPSLPSLPRLASTHGYTPPPFRSPDSVYRFAATGRQIFKLTLYRALAHSLFFAVEVQTESGLDSEPRLTNTLKSPSRKTR
jgi:hypothetical protein